MTTDLPDPHGCPHCGFPGLAERWGETICGMCGAPRRHATPGCPVRNVMAGEGGLFSIREAAEDERERRVRRKADMLPPDRSEQERRDARAKLAKKFSDEVSKWPAKKLRACFAQPETVAAAEKRERKAKRAKGAK